MPVSSSHVMRLAPLALINVHVPSLATDEGFVHFDFSADFAERLILQGEPDAMKHEPCRLLSDTESAGHFVGANPVLAVGQHPSCGQPLVQADRRILEDGSNLDGELPLGMMARALPDAAGLVERDFSRPASRADNPIRPATRNKVIEAVIRIREVNNRFLQALWFAHGLNLHELKVP